MGAAIKVAVDTESWRSFECRKDYLFGKLFRSRSSRNIQWRKYLHDIIQKTIKFSIPPKRFRFWLSDDGECHSYLQARHPQARHLIQCFEEFSNTIGFLYLSKGLESGCQEYKEPSPYFSEFLLTIIKWLIIDIIVTGS